MVYLVQYLCPRRHAIGALAYDPNETSQTEAEALLLLALFRGRVNPWCGLCGSQRLTYEHGATQYETIAEAEPFLRDIERKNAITRAFFRRY